MYYEGDPKKDLRIKYHADRTDNEANHKNNIYIGGSFIGSGTGSDWQNVIIGLTSVTYSYRNVILGNNSNCDGCQSVCIGTESVAHGYSTTVGYDAASGLYAVAIGHDANAKKDGSIAIGSGAQATGLYSIATGSNCVNSSNYHIKF
jgi:hypothetical protein